MVDLNHECDGCGDSITKACYCEGCLNSGKEEAYSDGKESGKSEGYEEALKANTTTNES